MIASRLESGWASVWLSLALTAQVAATPPTAPVNPPTNPAPATSAPAAQAAPASYDRSILGIWQGMLTADQGTMFVRVEVLENGDAPSVLVTAPLALAVKVAAADVSAEGRDLSFTLAQRGVTGRFSGSVDEEGKAYAGTLSLQAAGQEPSSIPMSLARSYDAKGLDSRTTYEGALAFGGTSLPLALTLAESPAGPVGALDIPMQSLDSYPALIERKEGNAIVVTLPLGVDAVMDLAPTEDGTALKGTFRQATVMLPIELKKAAGASTVVMNRPQLPKPPFPYEVRAVTIPHRFGHTLAGTFTLPKRGEGSPARFPAVVLATGSGPQDRDETLMGHKPFAVLADALTRAGVAVLRVDDRGVGASTGAFEGATTFDFATDIDECTEWLRKQSDVDPSRIGIIGHSEGALIAPIVAKWQWDEESPKDPIAFIVLLAGPGVNGKEILVKQMRRILEASGASKESVDAVSAAHQKALAAAAPGNSADALASAVRALVEEQAKLAALRGEPMDDAAIEMGVKGGVAQLSSPWMREFMTLDPAPWIAALRIPILAVYGELDTQVDADQNEPAVEAAARQGGAKLTVHRYPGINHLLQPAKTGLLDEYATIETTIDPTVLRETVEWVREQGYAPRATDASEPAPDSSESHPAGSTTR